MQERLQYLLEQQLTGSISDEEVTELNNIVKDQTNKAIFIESVSLFMETNTERLPVDREVWENRIQAIVGTDSLPKFQRPVHRVHFLKTSWFKYAAAIIILFGIGAYLWNTQQKKDTQITETKPVPVKNDIMPGSDRAVLTLSNGKQVQLNDAGAETIKEGGLAIENVNGTLKYSSAASSSDLPRGARPKSSDETAAYNTMTTPKGGQYQLTLADGTRVWLNAASSITYPVAFNGKSREVTITGEAYFEVKKNPSKPFVVKTPKENITVLGTEFNVNAYPDEKSIKTSLLEGSVKIASTILKPGQAYTEGKVIATNIQQDVAWKNGYFNFAGADLPTVMRQLARWYDIEVVYTGKVPFFDFEGELPKSLTLSQVLKILERLDVKFTVQGRKLIVSP